MHLPSPPRRPGWHAESLLYLPPTHTGQLVILSFRWFSLLVLFVVTLPVGLVVVAVVRHVFVLPILLLVSMSTILHYNSFCLCIVCSFLIEVITINILAILNHLCIVKSLHIFLERWEAILLSFLSYLPNYRDKNISIKSTVVLLRFPQWASFPI